MVRDSKSKGKNQAYVLSSVSNSKNDILEEKTKENKELRLLAAKLPPFPNSMDSIPVLLVAYESLRVDP